MGGTRRSRNNAKGDSSAPTPATVTTTAAARPVVHVLSDSTGNLARHMLAAFLTQFPPDSISLRFRSFVRTEGDLVAALEDVRRDPGAVCHAMVSANLKKRIGDFCRTLKLPCHDLTGEALAFLARATGVDPLPNTDSLHRLDRTYSRRIGALEFTLGHDDGLGLDTLREADIVLAGVSRTSKTPTSILLAQQGYRVANVSLALEVGPPQALLALTKRSVVGLTISPQQLTMIRRRREAEWGMHDTRYGDPDHVIREVAWARRLFNEHSWPVLDVTDQAVEETAARVLQVLGLTGPPGGEQLSPVDSRTQPSLSI
jgi:[pyruvate, water dikinase]-phosphate phosphotransferase / [pyruvate, water dikinase] kinase